MSTVDQVMDVLIEHTRINPPSGECSCGFVGQLGRRFTEHQAQELHKAGLLRRDLEDDFGLSGIEIKFAVDKQPHVHIERGGVPIVDGYIEGLVSCPWCIGFWAAVGLTALGWWAGLYTWQEAIVIGLAASTVCGVTGSIDQRLHE